jgi:hypothetical protein
MLPDFSALVIFPIEPHFYTWAGMDHSLPIYACPVAGMTGTHKHAQPLVEIGGGGRSY